MNKFGPMIAAFCLSVVLGSAASGFALWRRLHGSVCQGKNPTYTQYRDEGIGNTSTSGYIDAICPLPDDDGFPKTSVASLNVHGEDNSSTGYVSVSVCKVEYTSTTYTCGTTKTSANGSYQISFSSAAELSPWSTLSGAGYLYVSIPPQASGGQPSTVRAIFEST